MELSLLCAHDAPALWALETTHRAFFDRGLQPPRPESFYTPQGFARAVQGALMEQAGGHAFHYLVKVEGELVGRISLTQVRRSSTPCACLSYHIAPTHSGQGLASQAVQQVMEKAFHTHGLQRVEATARPDHPASVRVLLKNGFQAFGHPPMHPQLHRQWLEQQFFAATAPGAPSVAQP